MQIYTKNNYDCKSCSPGVVKVTESTIKGKLKATKEKLQLSEQKLQLREIELVIKDEILKKAQQGHSLKNSMHSLRFYMDMLGYARKHTGLIEKLFYRAKKDLEVQGKKRLAAEDQLLESEKRVSRSKQELDDIQNLIDTAPAQLQKLEDQVEKDQVLVNNLNAELPKANNQMMADQAANDAAWATLSAANESLIAARAVAKKPQEDLVKAKLNPMLENASEGDEKIDIEALEKAYNAVHEPVVKAYEAVAFAKEIADKASRVLIESQKIYALKQKVVAEAQAALQATQNALEAMRDRLSKAKLDLPSAKKHYEESVNLMVQCRSGFETADRAFKECERKVAERTLELGQSEGKLREDEKNLEDAKNYILNILEQYDCERKQEELKLRGELKDYDRKMSERKQEELKLRGELKDYDRNNQNLEIEIRRLNTRIIANEGSFQRERDKNTEYNHITNIMRPIVAMFAASMAAYAVYNNPIVVINGVNLLCRMVGLTFDDLNAMLGGKIMEVFSAMGAGIGYISSPLLTDAIYVSLKLVNSIIDIIKRVLSYLFKAIIDIINFIYVYINMILVLIVGDYDTFVL